jgi:hypothetical protein
MHAPRGPSLWMTQISTAGHLPEAPIGGGGGGGDGGGEGTGVEEFEGDAHMVRGLCSAPVVERCGDI